MELTAFLALAQHVAATLAPAQVIEVLVSPTPSGGLRVWRRTVGEEWKPPTLPPLEGPIEHVTAELIGEFESAHASDVAAIAAFHRLLTTLRVPLRFAHPTEKGVDVDATEQVRGASIPSADVLRAVMGQPSPLRPAPLTEHQRSLLAAESQLEELLTSEPMPTCWVRGPSRPLGDRVLRALEDLVAVRTELVEDNADGDAKELSSLALYEALPEPPDEDDEDDEDDSEDDDGDVGESEDDPPRMEPAAGAREADAPTFDATSIFVVSKAKEDPRASSAGIAFRFDDKGDPDRALEPAPFDKEVRYRLESGEDGYWIPRANWLSLRAEVESVRRGDPSVPMVTSEAIVAFARAAADPQAVADQSWTLLGTPSGRSLRMRSANHGDFYLLPTAEWDLCRRAVTRVSLGLTPPEPWESGSVLALVQRLTDRAAWATEDADPAVPGLRAEVARLRAELDGATTVIARAGLLEAGDLNEAADATALQNVGAQVRAALVSEGLHQAGHHLGSALLWALEDYITLRRTLQRLHSPGIDEVTAATTYGPWRAAALVRTALEQWHQATEALERKGASERARVVTKGAPVCDECRTLHYPDEACAGPAAGRTTPDGTADTLPPHELGLARLVQRSPYEVKVSIYSALGLHHERAEGSELVAVLDQAASAAGAALRRQAAEISREAWQLEYRVKKEPMGEAMPDVEP